MLYNIRDKRNLKEIDNVKPMEQTLRILLPIYFLVYFGLVFVVQTALIAKKIGTNPLVFPKDDSAYGLIGHYFKLTLIALFLYVSMFAFFPQLYNNFLPITPLENHIVKYIGLGLLLFALIWTVIAQSHMRNSWRIGIDTNSKTELVTTGLFSFSRNPIFFSMIANLFGLFVLTPNAMTGMIFILGYVLIQIQVRLEEEFLLDVHGDIYRKYCDNVRRWI